MVGLTGGIGSGKSAAAARLAAHGAVVIDADRLARDVVGPGTEGFDEVVRAFGDRVRGADGGLDRAVLGEIVFADGTARRRLEGIVHPRVRARTAQLTAAAPADAVVVNDVPLLVEVGLAPTYHLVIVVETARELRVRRLVRDRGMSAEQAHQRIRAQADDARRRAAADVVLTNDGTLDELHAQIDELWRDRLVPYERNVRERRAVRRPGPVVLVAPDPTWPAQFARLAARIRHTAGDVDLRIDHIGSTAVPELPAKDVIDLQVTLERPDAAADLPWDAASDVPSVVGPDASSVGSAAPGTDDERKVLLAAAGLAERLGDAGFPPYPGEWWDNPRFPGGAERWPKRLHGSADPARPVNLHLRVAGTPGWRFALLMRDHLRADPERRADYLRHKRQLAAKAPDTQQYAAAKDPWLDEEHARAEEWAARTGWRP